MVDLVSMHISDLESLRLAVATELDRRKLLAETQTKTDELVNSMSPL